MIISEEVFLLFRDLVCAVLLNVSIALHKARLNCVIDQV